MREIKMVVVPTMTPETGELYLAVTVDGTLYGAKELQVVLVQEPDDASKDR